MFKFILSLLLLPACLFGASIPFSGANPTQLGANASTGQLWITNNPTLTNITIYSDLNRTQALVFTQKAITYSNAVGVQFILTNFQAGFGTVPTAPLHLKFSNTVTAAGINGAYTISTENTATNISNAAGYLWVLNRPSIRFSAAYLKVSGDLDTNSSYFSFGTSDPTSTLGAAERMRINSLGYLGLWTTAPTERLTVNGNASISTNTFITNKSGSSFFYGSGALTNATAIGGAFDLIASNAVGSVTLNGGSIAQTAGRVLSIASGSNQRAGNATLVGGTITVNNTTVTANTVVILTRKTSGGTLGTAITYTLSAGASFTINSDSAIDTSVFSYLLVEVP